MTSCQSKSFADPMQLTEKFSFLSLLNFGSIFSAEATIDFHTVRNGRMSAKDLGGQRIFKDVTKIGNNEPQVHSRIHKPETKQICSLTQLFS